MAKRAYFAWLLRHLAIFCCCLGFVGVTPTNGLADIFTLSQKKILKRAFDDAARERFKSAMQLATQSQDPDMIKVVKWMAMVGASRYVNFSEIAQFLNLNHHWPKRKALIEAGEGKMLAIKDKQLLDFWFSQNAPVSVAAFILKYNRASKSERQAIRKYELVDYWINLRARAFEEKQFLQKFKKYLPKSAHIERLNQMLWARSTTVALRQAENLGKDYQRLAQARTKLIRNQPGVDRAIANVPTHLKQNPGLIFDRLKWRRQKGFHDAALGLLVNPEIEKGPYANRWWRERYRLARIYLKKGDNVTAYNLVSNHQTTSAYSYSQAEWFAGWIGLILRNNSFAAEQHFRRMYDMVNFPISKARGAYWTARALEAQGREDAAINWYDKAAGFMTTFYGQLAAQKVGYQLAIPLPEEIQPSPTDRQSFFQSELPRIILKLKEIPTKTPLKLLFKHLARHIKDPLNFSLAAELAAQIQQPDLAIFAAKQAAKNQIILSRSGYPTFDIKNYTDISPALIYAMIRQESGFDQYAKSARGALGMMQLMPATARQMAKNLGLTYSKKRLLNDPAYNMRLGSAYMTGLLKKYDGHLPLALAAYNAGPSRVKKWIADNGDPRSDSETNINWIENIPFFETRNYIQRILENSLVYKLILNGATEPPQYFFETQP